MCGIANVLAVPAGSRRSDQLRTLGVIGSTSVLTTQFGSPGGAPSGWETCQWPLQVWSFWAHSHSVVSAPDGIPSDHANVVLLGGALPAQHNGKLADQLHGTHSTDTAQMQHQPALHHTDTRPQNGPAHHAPSCSVLIQPHVLINRQRSSAALVGTLSRNGTVPKAHASCHNCCGMLRIRTDYYSIKDINFVKLHNSQTDRSRA